MLMIGGLPGVAVAQSCDPCPPDCAMMKAAAASADPQNHGQPARQEHQTSAPCQAMLACQAAALAPVPVRAGSIDAPTVLTRVMHAELAQLPAPSWPPDPALRPPIQL